VKPVLLLGVLAITAHAEFQLLSVAGSAEFQVPPVFDFGSVTAGNTDTVQFRVRNTSSSSSTVYNLALAGQGFLLSSVPALPQTLAPQASFDFSVRFQANAAGSYSAGMTLPGISVMLTATVVPGLLYSVTSPVDFGAVVRGTSATIHVNIGNYSTTSLAIPSLSVHGQGFSLLNAPPAGFVLGPQQSGGFDLQFSPAADGVYSGTLTAGNTTYALTGTGIDPSLPKPLLSIQLPQPASGQQGTANIAYDAPARIAGTGTLTLDFQGPDDPSVALQAGGRSLTFPVSIGDTQAPPIPFQTGTTAGTIVLRATMGSASASQTVVIAPSPVSISAAQAFRGAGSVTLQLTGFDNTRTAGVLAFTFYDRSGNTIPPSPIGATADFSDFFQSSALGGVFLLTAVFPVNGDPSQIGAFTTQLTNSTGVFTTPKTSF
jgi:hypothetical protein